MALPYVSPAQMNEYRSRMTVFAKGAGFLDCISSHYLPDRSGVCDLTGAKDQEEIFVLANRAGSTLKVSRNGMQIIANILDIRNADEWFDRLREQKKTHRERSQQEALKKEEEKKNQQRTVLLRKKSPSIPLREKNS